MINDLRRSFPGAKAIYVYGGALDCSTHDVDVAVFIRDPPKPGDYLDFLTRWPNVDLQFIRDVRETLFMVYVVKTGLLVHGEPIDVDVNRALENELGRVGDRTETFLRGDNEVMVCKSLKELMYLVAALKCGIDGSSNWYRMGRCLRNNLGIEAPVEFKDCLSPPDLGTLRRVGEPVLNALLAELRRYYG